MSELAIWRYSVTLAKLPNCRIYASGLGRRRVSSPIANGLRGFAGLCGIFCQTSPQIFAKGRH